VASLSSASAYEQVGQRLQEKPARWLVTGCAGFIGSHLVETLLKLNQTVVGLDNCHRTPAKSGRSEVIGVGRSMA